MESRTRLMQLVSEELTRSLSDDGAMKLVGLGITSLPPEAVELIKDNVERLSLQQNKLAILPQYFSRLEHLRYLDLRDNNFKTFPMVLTQMNNLEILDLSVNSLSDLPIGLHNLKVLSLKNNKFTSIPASILDFEHLRLLELENNPFHPNTKSYINNIPFKNNTLEWVQQIKTFLKEEPYDDHPLTAVQQQFPIHERLERSRSTSESYVSSRAAKRMGFIIKRQDAIEEDEHTLDPRRNRSFSTGTTPSPDHDKEDMGPEHTSNDYFKRLSTLEETNPMTRFKIVDIARKLLFAFSEFQSTMKKLNTFCTDKQVIIEMVSQLYSSKTIIDHLVESLEHTDKCNEEGFVSIDGILKTVTTTVSNFKKMVDTLTLHYTAYTKNSDVVFIRMLLLSLFMCYSEVFNAFKNLTEEETLTINTRPTRATDTITQQQLNEYGEVDDKLYESLHNVLQSSNQVYSELNDAISKSAIANAKNDDYQLTGNSITKIKELTSTCVLSMDLNKKIKMKLGNQNQAVKALTLIEKKKFYDEINALLKSIITILASTKAIMNESVILHEVRPSLASLTKATKDVTIMLEVSSYRLINDSFSSFPQSATAVSAPLLSAIPSVMSIPQMNTPMAFTTPMSSTSTSNPFDVYMAAHASEE